MAKLHTITKQQQQALWAEDNKVEGADAMATLVDERMSKYWETHDTERKPSRYAKQVTGWAKNNILLDIWDGWVSMEEAMGEQVFGLPVGETIGTMTRFEQVQAFHAYLGGYLESVEESLSKEEA